ncbi:MAG: hypothetical protein DRJ42_25385 [Deltaproteobacteria bacterium]|nr:MAG: hypothetical protein DRJ42_25385 [Deltaproteobacteria bacterium]
MNGAVQRLRAEVQSDRRAIDALVAELRELGLGPAASAGDLARAAVALHHAYSAFESIMLRVARQLEGEPPDGPDWHLTLLESMGLALEGIRDPLWSSRVIAGLRRLMAFRHFFRHAYTVPLDGERLSELREGLLEIHAIASEDLDHLDAFLQALAEPPGSSSD